MLASIVKRKSKFLFPYELMEYIWVRVVEHSHGKGVKPKMRGRKLRRVLIGIKAKRSKTRATCTWKVML
jgi:hypothetical protein